MAYHTIDEESEATFIHQAGQFQVRAAKILKIALAKIQALKVEVECSDAQDWLNAAANNTDEGDPGFYVFNTDRWDCLIQLLDDSTENLASLVNEASSDVKSFVQGGEDQLKCA